MDLLGYTTYRHWRDLTLNSSESGAGLYADVPGFCRSAGLEEIAEHGYVLTPGRYVGAVDVEDDVEPFVEKMDRLTATLREQFAESARLEQVISENLQRLGL